MGTHLQSLKSNLQNKGYRITKPNQDHGKRAQGSKDVLSSHAQTSELQSYPVQKGQGVSLLPGSKTTKKITLKMETTYGKDKKKYVTLKCLKRCKYFELGGDKRKKGQMIQF